MKKMKTWFGAAVLCTLFSATPAAAEGLPFKVTPEFSATQKEAASFFHLDMTKERKQEISVVVQNVSDGPIRLSINAANAMTAKNGGIHYTEDSGNEFMRFIDPTYEAAKLMTLSHDLLKLGKGEEKRISVTLRVPEKAEGVYLGGLLFAEEGKGETKKTNQGKEVAFVIETRAQYALAIQMDAGKIKEEAIGIHGAKAVFHPSGLTASFRLSNHSAAIATMDELAYSVFDRKGNLVQTGSEKNVKMAPKTEIDYSFYWDGAVKEGSYTLKVYSTANGVSVTKEMPFDVMKKEVEAVKQYEQKDPEARTEQENQPFWFAVGVIAAFGLGVWLRVSRKKP